MGAGRPSACPGRSVTAPFSLVRPAARGYTHYVLFLPESADSHPAAHPSPDPGRAKTVLRSSGVLTMRYVLPAAAFLCLFLGSSQPSHAQALRTGDEANEYLFTFYALDD